jgi:hypothetical protein
MYVLLERRCVDPDTGKWNCPALKYHPLSK